MTLRPLRALLVENSRDDADLVAEELRRGGFDVSSERVQTAETMRRALERDGPWDVVLSDFLMPSFTGLQALSLLRETGLDVPFILVSGSVGEDVAVQAMKAGAQDFFAKHNLTRLPAAVERELREAESRAERRVADLRLQEERRHNEAEREKLLAELREAVAARDEFLSVAAHELRTPLTPLQLKLQSLRRATEDATYVPAEQVRKHIDVVSTQLRKLMRLVNDLLDVSRIGRLPLVVSDEAVDFVAIVREVVERCRAQASQAQSPLQLDLPPSLEGLSDPVRLEQIFQNLLLNALKYGAGSPIEVSLLKDGGTVRLRVTDHGIGIAAADRERIFGRFERAVSQRNYGGLGLGLYLTRHFVEALQGTIRVESTPGEGASFLVELPWREQDARA